MKRSFWVEYHKKANALLLTAPTLSLTVHLESAYAFFTPFTTQNHILLIHYIL